VEKPVNVKDNPGDQGDLTIAWVDYPYLQPLNVHRFLLIDFWSLFQRFVGVFPNFQAQKNTTFAPDFKCLPNSFVSTIK